MALRQRLLRDIVELQAKPYPNISIFPRDNIEDACLVLRPNGGRPLHLSVHFGADYPLQAPTVSIQSSIRHPNIFGSYICASILNTEEGYTSAYTLKGIAIQLLSFFSSDRLEQLHGLEVEDLTSYRLLDNRDTWIEHECCECGFGIGPDPGSSSDVVMVQEPEDKRTEEQPKGASTGQQLANLPDEILLLICNELDTEELFVFARAWGRIGGEEGIMTRFDLIRTRELQCFCLKRSFLERDVQLGVGVNVAQRGRQGILESEFDLLSLEAYKQFRIRRSIQGLRFQYWLPLPISPRHYQSVKEEVNASAREIGTAAKLASCTPVNVVYHFMNDVVVKFSQEASKSLEHQTSYGRVTPQSTLKHASEKAIESYFHLFHLLLCLATPAVVRSANHTIETFLSGQTSKTASPNLGHLLIAVLISDIEMRQGLMMAIIKETVTRNVVWMLDARGAGMAELSYMEASAVSNYRLQKTFEASKTSYRLLMFFNLLRLATGRASIPRKSLAQLRQEMFDRHGAPPRGASTRLANEVKHIHTVNTFPDFLRYMGIEKMPTAAEFTAFLRRSLEESVVKGYSVWAISQDKALALRRAKEPNVEIRKGQKPEWHVCSKTSGSFFPGTGRR